ncbi:MAG: hypothetical protein NZ918_00135, partial [Aigarchaeota archaeon]|nr:hypothetical protein [Aigarchaeota archaeon]
KQVLKAILRRLNLINDGKRGWLNHPIVLMYYNDGRAYIQDLVSFFPGMRRRVEKERIYKHYKP